MIKYFVETLDTCLDEIKPLLEKHWKEVAYYQDKQSLNPDYDKYQWLEDHDMLHIVTARSEGLLIGYFVSLMMPSLHYQDTVYANNDLVFLLPEFRKGFTAFKMFKFAFNELKKKDVDIITIHMKVNNPFSRLCEALKMDKQELLYSKYIGE